MSDTQSISSILTELAEDLRDTFFGNERQSDLIRICRKYNFKYVKRLYVEELDVELKSLSIFRRRSKKLQNIVVKKEPSFGLDLLIFDYNLRGNSRRNRTSCTLIECKAFDFPHFLIRPKKAGEIFKEFFFLRDIILDYRPDFNKHYRIKTNHPEFINRIISDDIADLMIREKNIFIEGINDYILIYKKKNLIPAQDIPSLYRFVIDFATLFQESNREFKST
ncbi:MAG: hypothetical protein R3250_11850 [Melioribacteraceae bacterium]|nr:hypothetical protein [Melioribacteraceae bacterium]